MAFTKINAAGIGTTETVTVDGLTVINDGSFGGNLTVGGVLTYEDVTNVDSVGLITARNGIVVGSGITLSKDGDVFFTGIATGNGSGLTDLNASNLASGTVPTARLGSGTASSSTFLRGDSTFQTVNTDLVSDTSPQLGGNLDVNTKNIVFGDSSGASDDRLTFGAGTDLSIFHDGSNSYVRETGTGSLFVEGNSHIYIGKASGGAENGVVIKQDGAVELYHDNAKKIETISTGVLITGSDDGDGGAKGDFKFLNTSGALKIMFDASTAQFEFYDGSKATFGNGDDLIIHHNGTNSFIDNNTGDLYLQTTGSGDDILIESADNISLKVHGSEDGINITGDGSVQLYYDNGLKLETNSGGVSILNSGGIPALSVSAAGSNRADVRILASGTGEAYLWMDAANGDLSGGDYAYFQHRNSDLALLMSNYGGDVYINCRGGSLGSGTLDTAFKANMEGSVELYYDGQKKFQTISDGFETGGSFATDGTTSGVRCTAGSLIQTSENSTAFRYAARFYNPNGQVGYISTQNNNTTFNTNSSDRSVKKNFEDWTENTLDLFKNIKPQKFNFINEDDGSEKTKGFIAQEMVDKFPEAYTKSNEEDAKYAFNPSGMVVYLMKALQEATIKIEALETKVAALEG